MIKRAFLLFILLAAPLLAVPASVGAVNVFNQDVCERNVNDSNQSTVCKDQKIGAPGGKQQNPIFGKGGILTTVISILTSVVAIIAVITIILAGLKFITSGSNPQEVSKAREQIIYACVALAIAGLAQAVVVFILNRIEG